MKEQLALFLNDAGIEPGALFIALENFLTHGDIFSQECSDTDSMLTYLKKESIQDFMKLLLEDAPPFDVD